MQTPISLKDEIRNYWDRAACGEIYATGASLADQLEEQARTRYRLEPYLPAFARFAEGAGRDVLEVGVGMGADHREWARHGPRSLSGIDLTARGVDLTRRRLELYGLSSDLRVADSENLPFHDECFDLVYSWGVLHHTPDTARAILEIRRVLRPGGRARVMIYHRRSLVGWMLWMRYGLLAGRPRTRLDELYSRHLESPGTKAYSLSQARMLFSEYTAVSARIQLSFGDLLEGEVGQRHSSRILAAAKRVWPRRLIKEVFGRFGLYVLIDAVK